nr:OsmC family protein [Candidatus Njordarchaeum guaymaensis]
MATQQRKIEFQASLSWDGKSGGEVKVSSGHALRIDTPRDFGGEGRYPCPDELFFSAIGGCLITTFLYMHKKIMFNLKGLQVSVTGNVESMGTEGFRIRRVGANMNVETDQEGKDKARNCIEMTKRFCHITRSIEKSIPIEISWKVTVRTSN